MGKNLRAHAGRTMHTTLLRLDKSNFRMLPVADLAKALTSSTPGAARTIRRQACLNIYRKRTQPGRVETSSSSYF